MELTGKCKEEFEEWYDNNYETQYTEYTTHDNGHCIGWVEFSDFPFSMQWGVYLDFFELHGILVCRESVNEWAVNTGLCDAKYSIERDEMHLCESYYKNRKDALKRSNEFFNASHQVNKRID